MDKFDELLQFLIDNKNDNRISIFKRMKYGYRYYHISFSIDTDPINKPVPFDIERSMNIIFDNRNKCVEIEGRGEYAIIIEDLQLLEKWSTILEDILNENVEKRVVDIFTKTIESCYNKNLHRELQMKKILQ